MKNRKFSCLLLLALMLLALEGCSGAPDDVATVDPAAVKTSHGIPKEQVKVGVLYISDPAEGAGYTFTQHLGIQEMQRSIGLSDSQVVIKKNIPDEAHDQVLTTIDEMVRDGCNIIFATSFGYMDAMAEKAEEYPNVWFFHGSGYKSNDKNFSNYFGRIYQPRYLSGLVAGMKTQSNKIGYVAAMGAENSEVTGGIDAFAMGVAAVNPNANILVKVTNSWFDPAGERAAAEELLALDCDVIAQHCDTSYPLEAAEQKGVWGVGYNSDMRRQTPKATLVSVIWRWGAFYTDAVQQLIDGTWTPHNYFGGMNEGMVGITSLSDLNADNVEGVVMAAEKDILSGKQKIFTGQIPTNDGGMVGVAGQDFSDADITGNIHWYYKNVVLVP